MVTIEFFNIFFKFLLIWETFPILKWRIPLEPLTFLSMEENFRAQLFLVVPIWKTSSASLGCRRVNGGRTSCLRKKKNREQDGEFSEEASRRLFLFNWWPVGKANSAKRVSPRKVQSKLGFRRALYTKESPEPGNLRGNSRNYYDCSSLIAIKLFSSDISTSYLLHPESNTNTVRSFVSTPAARFLSLMFVQGRRLCIP